MSILDKDIQLSYCKKYFAGFISGLLQTVIVHPLDILRVRYFLHGDSIGSLSNGLLFNITSSSIKYTVFYPTQDLLGKWLKQQGFRENWSDLITGAMFGCISNPINSIKVPLQASPVRKSMLKITKEIYRNHGLNGFTRGGLGVICRDIVWTTTYFPLYRYILEQSDNRVYSSVGASIVSTSLSYGFDGARLCRQQHSHNHPFIHGFIESFRPTAKNLKSYTSGVSRVTVATLIGHYSYSYLTNFE